MWLINLLRAKSEDQESFLLKDHIIETLRRLKQLKEFVDSNINYISYQCLKDPKFFEALAIALILHDLGKINYDFQKRVYKKDDENWIKLSDFLSPLRDVKVRHEILSAIWASILLNDTNMESKDWLAKIRTAILLHHYNEYFINEKDLMEIIHDYLEDITLYLEFIIHNWDKLAEFLDELLNEIHREFSDDFISSAVKEIRNNLDIKRANDLLEKIRNHEDDISEFAEFYNINNEKPDYRFLLFLGCLRRCDYSASGNIDIEKVSDLKEVYKELEDKIKMNVRSKSLWQKAVLKNIEPSKSIVLIAPTGAGKTEFALLWAEKNKRKLIYTLPLRVALNDLFWRFRKGKTEKGYFDDNFVDILHSTAFIEYLEEIPSSRQLDVEKQLTASKLLSSPVLLTTPDQVFLTSLNYYGSDKVLAVYPLSSIVIDEIQTYDEEMASIIIKTLQIVKETGGVVLVMTATLPPYFEPFFFEDKSKYYDIPEKFRLNFEIVDTEKIKEKVKNYTIKRHKIKIVDKPLTQYKKKEDGKEDLEVNSEELKNWIDIFKDRNTFIVVNNVSKAIAIYDYLKNNGYNNVFLLHSRLIEKVKDQRIEEIKNKLNSGEKVIVVATQIIEASVDLDFDAMITEISPIDSQIQRWGRVYRSRGDKNYEDEKPNIIIFIGEFENNKIKIDKGTKLIYDDKVIEKTVDILRDYEGKLLNYEDERNMVKDVFEKLVVDDSGNKTTLKDFYVKKICKNLEFLKYFTVEKKHQAQRLFRRIAGVQIVIPTVMEIYGDEIDKIFAKIIKNPENSNMTWNEIVEKISTELPEDNRYIIDKWKLKKRLYHYSINVPIFYWEDSNLLSMRTHEFKGFQVLNITKEDAEKIYEYGIAYSIIRKLNKKEEDCEIL